MMPDATFRTNVGAPYTFEIVGVADSGLVDCPFAERTIPKLIKHNQKRIILLFLMGKMLEFSPL